MYYTSFGPPPPGPSAASHTRIENTLVNANYGYMFTYLIQSVVILIHKLHVFD